MEIIEDNANPCDVSPNDMGNSTATWRADIISSDNPYKHIIESFRRAKECMLIFGKHCGETTLAFNFMSELYKNYNQVRISRKVILDKHRTKRKHSRMFK